MPLGPIKIVVIAFPRETVSTARSCRRSNAWSTGAPSASSTGCSPSRARMARPHWSRSVSWTRRQAPGLDTVLDRVEGLISDEDVEAFTRELAPNSSAAIMAFEHTWLTPLRERIADAGGI